MNMTSRSGGVAQTCFYQFIARCLGHCSLTKVTLTAYIDRIGGLIHDNSAVLFGEEEGAVGGLANCEARVERLIEYRMLQETDTGGGEGDRDVEKYERVTVGPPKLAPSLSRAVASDPAVEGASREVADIFGECSRASKKRRLVGNGGVNVPPGLGGPWKNADVEELTFDHAASYARLGVAAKGNERARKSALRRATLELEVGVQTKGEGDVEGEGEGAFHLILNSFPDLLKKAVNILKDYHEGVEGTKANGKLVCYFDPFMHINYYYFQGLILHCAIVVCNLFFISHVEPNNEGVPEEVSSDETKLPSFRRVYSRYVFHSCLVENIRRWSYLHCIDSSNTSLSLSLQNLFSHPSRQTTHGAECGEEEVGYLRRQGRSHGGGRLQEGVASP